MNSFDQLRLDVAAPIFLVGAERSGSTLLRLMLDHHPEIAFEREFDFAVELISDNGDLPTIETYTRYLKFARGMDYVIDPSLTYPELVNDFLRQKLARSGKTGYVGATLHHEFHRLQFLWPNARFIHLVRDPRDVARSVLAKRWAGNLYHAAAWWTKAEHCWDILANKLPPNRYIEVRYEDLVADAEDELTRICRFIGVSYDSRMLDYPASAIQYPKPDPRLALQWKTRLSGREVALIESRSGSLLEDRGYPRTASNLNIKRLTHKSLMLQARIAQLGYRIQDYGLVLVCLDMLGRRMGLQAVADYAQSRINLIENETIRQEAEGFRAPSANIAPVFQRRS